MALTNQLTPEAAARSLTAWLEAEEGVEDVLVADIEIPSANGLSNETVLFTARWTKDGQRSERQLVARVEPVGAGLSPVYDIVKEGRLLQQLGSTDLPVPAVHRIETDTSYLGAPFLVMERLPGKAVPDSPSYFVAGWVFDLAADDRRKVAEHAIRTLGQVARIDPAGFELLERDTPGDTPLDRDIAYYEQWFDWAREGEANPVVEAAFAWVKEHKPEDEPVAVSWGDSRIGNVLYGPELDITGVLDWEFASLGSPELDLGWWLFIERHFLEPHGLDRTEGWPDRARTIELWEEASGRRAAHIDFHETYAGLRFCVMMVRAAALVKAAGAIPPDSPMAQINPGTQALAPLVGAELPDGVSAHVVSNTVD